MAGLANLNGVSETLPGVPKLPSLRRTQKRVRIIGFLGKSKKDGSQEEHSLQTTRRLALGLASIALVGKTCNGVSLADDNGFWINGTIPVPSVNNKIANENTGTRSFLLKRIFMAEIGIKGRIYRLRKTAFDLLAMEDLIGKDTLNYVQRYLKIKSTFMYYDFDRVITAAPVDDKQPLLDLANRLFDNVEKLDAAVKQRNLPETETTYRNTKFILQEVMIRMA
ncbi:Oxygen-evolving enhancer protein [Parasponia andersonii]|uniref:Oxygen-evolving enhancer protein n=1 Tax=Parasponia andersonii TaxID=3476 RepID=A0A2P5CKB5_PARAD|nr:Oxygen-evolving enhancer protein [Parasponia andersonii]